MPDTPEFQEIVAKLRDFVAAEYHRGERDAIERVMRAAQSSGAGAPEAHVSAASVAEGKSEIKERAPAGAPEEFVRRVLNVVGTEGVKAIDIATYARTDTERLVSYSAIRVALGTGRAKGTYRNVGGKWFLKGKEKN
jgi:hypothetical protein